MYTDIVLDLDHTLIQTVSPNQNIPLKNRNICHAVIDGTGITFARPYLDTFLTYIFTHFRVSVWTAASRAYAEQIVRRFILTTPTRKLHKFYTDTMVEESERKTGHHKYLKYLASDFGVPLIIDDRVDVYESQPFNAYLIKSFHVQTVDAQTDTELLKVITYLQHSAQTTRV